MVSPALQPLYNMAPPQQDVSIHTDWTPYAERENAADGVVVLNDFMHKNSDNKTAAFCILTRSIIRLSCKNILLHTEKLLIRSKFPECCKNSPLVITIFHNIVGIQHVSRISKMQ